MAGRSDRSHGWRMRRSSGGGFPQCVSCRTRLLAIGVDDEDVAVGLAYNAGADAAGEQPLEETRFACANDDQIGAAMLGLGDDLLVRWTERGDEFVLHALLAQQRLDPLAVLAPGVLCFP